MAARRLVAQAMRGAMEDRGLSEEVLAQATGIPREALRSGLEARSAFTLAELEVIGRVLGTPPSSLLE